MIDARMVLEQMVLTVHRRSGGNRMALDFDATLLSSEFGLDSLDLAEIMVHVERRFGISPFEQSRLPRVWNDVVGLVERTTASGPYQAS